MILRRKFKLKLSWNKSGIILSIKYSIYRLKEFVLDFDNLRKGTVTKDQFNRLLTSATVTLEPEEFDTLVQSY